MSVRCNPVSDPCIPMWTGVSSLFESTEPSRGRKHHSLGLPRIKVKAVFSATLLSGLPLSDIFLRILVCSLPIISPITRNIYMSFPSQACLLQPFVLDPRCHRGGPMDGRLRLWHAVSFTCLLASTQDYSTLYQSGDWVPNIARDQHFCFAELFFFYLTF